MTRTEMSQILTYIISCMDYVSEELGGVAVTMQKKEYRVKSSNFSASVRS